MNEIRKKIRRSELPPSFLRQLQAFQAAFEQQYEDRPPWLEMPADDDSADVFFPAYRHLEPEGAIALGCGPVAVFFFSALGAVLVGMVVGLAASDTVGVALIFVGLAVALVAGGLSYRRACQLNELKRVGRAPLVGLFLVEDAVVEAGVTNVYHLYPRDRVVAVDVGSTQSIEGIASDRFYHLDLEVDDASRRKRTTEVLKFDGDDERAQASLRRVRQWLGLPVETDHEEGAAAS